MDDFTVELYAAENRADARGVESLLQSEGIECVVVVFQDTAIPGVGDQNRPWAMVRVRTEDVERARELVESWKQGVPEDIEQAWDKPGTE